MAQSKSSARAAKRRIDRVEFVVIVSIPVDFVMSEADFMQDYWETRQPSRQDAAIANGLQQWFAHGDGSTGTVTTGAAT